MSSLTKKCSIITLAFDTRKGQTRGVACREDNGGDVPLQAALMS